MIYILIPVHNRKEFTRQCLLSLRKQTYKKIKIVVIDDGSLDGTGGMLAREFPAVHVIKGDGNLWWADAQPGEKWHYRLAARQGDDGARARLPGVCYSREFN